MASINDGFRPGASPEARRAGRMQQRQFQRGTAESSTRLLILSGGAKKPRVEEELAQLGYDVVARAENPEQAFAFTAKHLPDAVLVFLDSFDRASALLAMRVLGNRYTCAIVVLAQRLDRAMLAQLKMVTPHAVVPLSLPTEILDASIHAALDAAAQRNEARQARLQADAHAGLVPVGFDTYFNLAVGRALRNGTTFAAGVIEFVPDELEDEAPVDVSAPAVERLKSQLRHHDVVQRRSDSTIVFIAEDVGLGELEALGERVLRAVSGASRIGHERIPVWPAIGIALWSGPGQDAHGVLNAAEEATAQARAAGGGCWRIAQLEAIEKPQPPADEALPEATEPESRGVGPLVMLQRTIGWVSLAVLLWVAGNYAGLGSAENAAAQTHRLISHVMSLRLTLP